MKISTALITICIILLVGGVQAVTWTSASGCWTATNDTYTLVMWNATGTSSWTPPAGVTSVEYLVVAGGGSGGGAYYPSGGGGGGQVKTATGFSVTPGTGVTVTVGAGGAAKIGVTDTPGNAGANSSFDTIVSTKGSGGLSTGVGGASGSGYTGGTTHSPTTAYEAGGGAGDSANGVNWATLQSGHGGAGTGNDITGSHVHYGGGGGGAASTVGAVYGNGVDGGGNGAINGDLGTAASHGTSGLGGGGGGSHQGNSGAGGSGIVIIRYLTPGTPTASFTPLGEVTGIDTKEVQFNDTSTGSPTGWVWYFGDETYDGAWVQQNASGGWAQRDAYTSVALSDGSIVLMGGYYSVNKLNDTWRSTDKGVTWILQNVSSGWSARSSLNSVALSDGSIVLMGGMDGAFDPLNDVWYSTNKGITWIQQNASSGWCERRWSTSVALPDGSIVLMGGATNGEGNKNDTWRSTDKGVTWTLQNASSGWSARYGLTSLVLSDNSILLIGGGSSSADYNDTWRSTDKGVTWTQISDSAIWAGKVFLSSVVLSDGSIVLMGGIDWDDNIIYNDVWRSTDMGITWTQMDNVERFSPSIVALPDGSIVLMGGYDGGYKNDTWRLETAGSTSQNPVHTFDPGNWSVILQAYNNEGYNISTQDTWVNVSESVPASPISSFTPLGEVTGIDTKEVQFNDTSTGSPTGWVWYFGDETYDGAWVQQNASGGWAQRDAYTSVALSDGSIVLMGGYYSVNKLNDTWRSTDKGVTWILQNVSSGWSARSSLNSVALSDGSIVLMGGYDGGEIYLNDTWRSTDKGVTWILQNASSEWSERITQSTVSLSDGSIVLMGGGSNGEGNKNDTWRSTDQGVTWTLQNASSGWFPRNSHTSIVSTDGSIFVIGGAVTFNELGYTFNDVWRSTDNGVTWSEQTEPVIYNETGDIIGGGAEFSIRGYFSGAALLDNSIIIMGGYGGGYKNDMWRSTDMGVTWALQNASSGWSARSSHTSVVLPDGSIVLMGGDDDTSYNDTWRLETAGSTSQNPVHTFDPGNWSVILQSYNNEGYNISTQDTWVNVSESVPASPISSFTPLGEVTGIDTKEVQFNDTSTGSPAGWAWYFGDETYDGAWVQQNASAGWSERTMFSTVALSDGSIVLMGGMDGAFDPLNDVWYSTNKGITWIQQNASSGWCERIWSTSVALPDGSIVLMGGMGEGYVRYNDTWRSTDKGVTWIQQNASSGWVGRSFHTSVSLSDGSIVLMGGGSSQGYFNDTWRSTDQGVTWTLQNASSGWSARYGLTSLVLSDNSILLIGGGSSSADYNDTWRSTDKGVTWTQISDSAIWAGKVFLSSVVLSDGSIVLMGGIDWDDNIIYNDVWRSTDMGITWTQMDNVERFYPSIVALPDGSIVLMGGMGEGYVRYNDTWRLETAGSTSQNPVHTFDPGNWSVILQAYNNEGYNISTQDTWVNVSESVPASPISSFTPLGEVTGIDTKEVQFNDTSTGSPTGWVWYFGDETYDGAWVQQNASADWSARYYHTSVSLSDGSIVLMGGNDGDLKNDVWRSTDNGVTWTLQNASSGWLARDYHTSVALPDDSIVLMGGYDNNKVTNDTWRSTDKGVTWTLQNASSGWCERVWHTSVALSDGSIVLMGGINGDDVTSYNDTWRSTDKGITWILQNASSGWSARYGFTSVALSDGSIVLMGGLDWDDIFYNDTWRSTDKGITWVQQNASSEWSARLSLKSVALSDGSIVLMGGYGDDGDYKNDVWRSTDNGVTWTLQNASSGWLARQWHTSVALPDDSIVLMGGYTNAGGNNDTWRLETAGSTSQNPLHTFDPGNWSVILQAYNNAGYNLSTQDTWVNVSAYIPIVTNFTATPTSGMYPLIVTFTDISTNTPTEWLWVFGDGSTENNTEQNPVHQYMNEGSYTVNLSITNSTGIYNITKPSYIYAYGGAPIANFTGTPTSGSAPLTVTFTDSSTNSTTTRLWDFGDGSTENNTALNPVHKYQSNGVYTVNLTTFNLVGSSNQISKTNYININIVSSFTPLGVINGVDPKTVQFTDTSTGNPTYWLWDFGDSTYENDTEQNPLHTFSAGNWSVNLLADDNIVDNLSTQNTWINVSATTTPVANFTGTPVIGTPQLTVTFTDSSTNAPTSWLWNFGDGSSTNNTMQNPVHKYASAGTYTVSLNATNIAGNNNKTRTGYIVVTIPPVSNFTADQMYGATPLTVTFTDNSTNTPTSWLWNFGDGSSVNNTMQNPVHAYTVAGIYSVSLTATNGVGSNTFSRNNYIYTALHSVSNFTGSPTTGTAPLTVTFTDCSTNIPTYWLWEFGDDTNSTQQSPSHTYTVDGTYSVSLSTYNYGGSDTKTRTNYIVVSPAFPVAGFTATPRYGPVGTEIQFTDTSTGNPTVWLWDFGDGSTENDTDQNPFHTYTGNGVYDVILTVENSVGQDDITNTGYIVITEDAIVTNPPDVNTSTHCVIFNGNNNGNASTVWFEYSLASTNGMSFKTVNQTGVVGDFTETICGMPLMSGLSYSVVAGADISGQYTYGLNRTFTMSTVQPHVTTTYENQVNIFVEDGMDPIKLFSYDIWQAYIGLMGGFFFGLLICFIFMNIAIKQRSVAISVILLLIIGTAIWQLLPAEFIQISQMLLIAAIAGLLYWLFMKKR